MRWTGITLAGVCMAAGMGMTFAATEWVSDIQWTEPPRVTPGEADAPPSDAIVLFGGETLSAWEGCQQWEIADGVATSAEGSISTKDKFGDCQLHLEFATPAEVSGDGQGRGNSGVYFMGHYELQVLDSWENDTYFDGQCASIYKQHPPLVNASRGPGEWQTYDVIFTAPRFEETGALRSPGAITVLHNGVLVQNHWVLQGTTAYTEPPIYYPHGEREALSLQFHGNPVQFRNIWIRDLMPASPPTEAAGN